jgi:hypothetical protein
LPPKRTLPLYGLVQALHKRNGALPVQKPRHLASAAGRGRDSGDFGSRSPGSPNPFLAPAGVALEDRRDQIDKPSMAYWRDLPRGSLANRSTGASVSLAGSAMSRTRRTRASPKQPSSSTRQPFVQLFLVTQSYRCSTSVAWTETVRTGCARSRSSLDQDRNCIRSVLRSQFIHALANAISGNRANNGIPLLS